jgi:hypothetical protein
MRLAIGNHRRDAVVVGAIFETVRIEDGKVSRIRLFLEEREVLEAAGLRE